MQLDSYLNTIGMAICIVVVCMVILFEYIRHHALVRSIKINRCKPIEYMMYRYEINIAVGLSINRNLTANKRLAVLYKNYADLVLETFDTTAPKTIDEFYATMKQAIGDDNNDYTKILNVFNDDINFAIKDTLRRSKHGHTAVLNPCEVSVFIKEWLVLNNAKI